MAQACSENTIKGLLPSFSYDHVRVSPCLQTYVDFLSYRENDLFPIHDACEPLPALEIIDDE